MKKSIFLLLFACVSIFSSCTKNADNPDYAAEIAGTYTASVLSTTGAVIRLNYVFTVARVSPQEVSMNDNSGTAPLKALITKSASTPNGDAYLGFTTAGQNISYLNFIELTKIQGITQLMQTIPDLSGTYNIVYDVKGKSLIIGINQGGVKGAIVASK